MSRPVAGRSDSAACRSSGRSRCRLTVAHRVPAAVPAAAQRRDLVVAVGAVLDDERPAVAGPERDALWVAEAVGEDPAAEVAGCAPPRLGDPEHLAAERLEVLRVRAHRGVACGHPQEPVGAEPRAAARVPAGRVGWDPRDNVPAADQPERLAGEHEADHPDVVGRVEADEDPAVALEPRADRDAEHPALAVGDETRGAEDPAVSGRCATIRSSRRAR